MKPAVLAAMVLLLAPVAAAAADALKISQIEQDIRLLQQQLREQARQIDLLQARLATAAAQPEAASPARPPAAPSQAWLDAAKWARVQAGMSELEVLTLLGPPTSMRADDEGRVLLYAMEIGASGFLAGSVMLRDRSVVQVENPQLR